MAFRKKAAFILAHQPDILIVPECEHPDKLKFKEGIPVPNDIFWQGTNQNKGLGVFSYGKYKFKLLDIHDDDIKIIVPLSVTGGAMNFTLLAAWAYNPLDKDYNYIGQVWKALSKYEHLLKKKNLVLTGDLNSNTIWDKLNRKTNHSMVVEKLKGFNIHSAYHQHFNLDQGKEAHPTFFLYRHEDKSYHIDYCFASANLINKLNSVEIGTHKDWVAHSDHSPVIVSFDL
jgi:exodeoxyribonuclease III